MPAFMLSVAARSSSAYAFAAHAGTACLAKVAFSAFHASAHLLRFGVLTSMRHATGRDAQAQSGCLPVGSLLTNRQLQSATAQRHEVACPAAVNGQHALRHLSSRHRQMGCPSVGGQQTNVTVSRLVSIRQNLCESNQGSAVMQRPNIEVHEQVGLFSSPSASRPCLTCWSSRRQQLAAVGALRTSCSGAAYRWR